METTYELMVLVRSDFPVEDEAKRNGLLQKLIGEGKIAEVTVLEKKLLAYPIQKQTEGIYLVVRIEASDIRVSTIEKESRLTNEVLRYILINKKEGKRRV
jgi:small subunit ribosomal protein S6